MNFYAFVKKNNASVAAINRSYPRIYQYITQQTTILQHPNFSRTAYYRTFLDSLLPILNIVKFSTSAECSRQR